MYTIQCVGLIIIDGTVQKGSNEIERSERVVLLIYPTYQPFKKFDRISDRFVGTVGRDATGLYEHLVCK